MVAQVGHASNKEVPALHCLTHISRANQHWRVKLLMEKNCLLNVVIHHLERQV